MKLLKTEAFVANATARMPFKYGIATLAIDNVSHGLAIDAQTDEATGLTYYQAVVVPDEASLAGMPELALRPGMPVETFLRTQDRTPLSYLTRPLTVYFQRAFRED